MGDGHIFTQSDAGASLNDQGRIPNLSIKARYVTVSPDGTKLYVVAGKETTGDWSADQIVVLDAASLNPSAVISPSEPFFDIALSKDGRYIYAPTPAATLLVIDTLNPTAIRKISGLGAAPVSVMVAP
jgi:DNA-binding beta-propeller fold protein YncE